MSIDTDMILSKIPNLSVEELKAIRAKIDAELEQKATVESPLDNSQQADESQKPKRLKLAHAYRRTPEEIETMLAAVFTPEEIAEIGKRDFSQRVLPGKSLSEMINEDREDRF